MSTDSRPPLELAYLDAMKRLRGSMLGPQLCEPIADYVNELEGRVARIDGVLTALTADLEELLDNNSKED